jgi:hypothetical protein
MSNKTDPLELIPFITATARTFDLKNLNAENTRGSTVTHADDLNTRLYRVCLGTITERRNSVVPDNREIILVNNKRHQVCITREYGTLGHNPAANQGIRFKEHMNPVNSASILQQLPTALSAQNEEAVKSNNLVCCNEILRQVSRDISKKNRTMKIHPSIIKMDC